MSDPSFSVESDLPHGLDSHAHTLTVRQQPERAKVFSGSQIKEKGRSTYVGAQRVGTAPADAHVDRKPIDPPPIVQLQITDPSDPAQNYLQSPYFFMCCSLVDAETNSTPKLGAQSSSDDEASGTEPSLQGILVSSLHRLKDANNTDGGFFVFPDVSVRTEGKYRLRFSLFEMVKQPVPHVIYIKSVLTNPFEVYSHRFFPGMLESTFLSRSFSDQGVRLRVRKEPRILGKRPAQSSDLPAHGGGEGSSRSGSIQEGSGLASPSDQVGPFSSAYGEPSPGFHPGPGASYRNYGGVPQRDPNAGRGSYYSQDGESAINYPQSYPSRQDQYQSMNPLQPGGPDSMAWNQSFQQQRFGRQTSQSYPMHEQGPQSFYTQSQGASTQSAGQYPPPVPPDRQLPSTGASMQQSPQSTYGGRGNPGQSYGFMPGQESYQQYPRSLAPVSSSNTAMSYPTSSAPHGSSSNDGTSQSGYNPQSGYGSQYPAGQHHYR